MNQHDRRAAIRGANASASRMATATFNACNFSDEPCRASRNHGLHCICGGLGRILSVTQEEGFSQLLALEPDERAALVEALVHDN